MQKLNLPCADIWIEADGKRISFELIDVTKDATQLIKKENPIYNIEKSYILRPKLPDEFKYQKLSLKTDDILEDCEDILSDTWYVGGNWFIDTKAICAVAFVDNAELEDHVDTSENELPFYKDISDQFKNKIAFQVTYKNKRNFISDSKNRIDLSLDFASDQIYYYLEKMMINIKKEYRNLRYSFLMLVYTIPQSSVDNLC
ncbi:hypothetical protein ACQW5G_01730 [Fructilactobacillus sp. Tb1]|uniref:hypothetical protein n=1 Tax=Fructilactobacillus sp. Tb1 TaxID=3422304 RepID=UPI003D29391A